MSSASAAQVADPSGSSTLDAQLARLPEFDSPGLRDQWRRICRSEPPRISRDLLMRALSYKLQELEFGGLPKWAKQSLAGAAFDPREASDALVSKPVPPSLKSGARLVREWHGRTHSVIVLDDAFEFEGKRYDSLTQIAREITGAHWSGPRFFGLVKRKAAFGLRGNPSSREMPEELTSSGLPVQVVPAALVRRDSQSSRDEGARRPELLDREQAHG